jgi:SAM-dependent methyltransferase
MTSDQAPQRPSPDPHALAEPSAWVVRFASLIVPGARVLDVACGRGRHAKYLAGRGCEVTAVDRDAQALAAIAGVSGVACFHADLESGSWPFRADSFDAVIVTNYLHRPLFRPISLSLRAGGVLLYETFMAGNERFGKPSNPDYLLRPHELLGAFKELRIIAFEQGVEREPVARAVQRLAAIAHLENAGPFPLPGALQID